MSGDVFGERRQALEDSFFQKRDRELLEKLQIKLKKEALSAVAGIHDDAVLGALVELNIGPETLTALTLVPLIQVAWADGSLDAKERAAVLDAAHESGLAVGSSSHQILDNWLATPPAAVVFTAWQEYTRSICGKLAPAARDSLKQTILNRARAIASTTGGVLGIGKISATEQAVLTQVELAFE